MKTVCVITGGGSGMGLAAAKCMPKDKIIVLAGRTASKLEKAVAELEELGYEAYFRVTDVSIRDNVRALAKLAASIGPVKNVINSAGLSPSMAKPEQLLRVNALGTVYVNQEFSKVMDRGSVILDVASNSGHMLPDFLPGRKTFALAETDEAAFLKKTLKLTGMVKDEYKSSGMAYGMSKKFVIWYAQKCAQTYGSKGIRVVSLSPGLIDTDMGRLEIKHGANLLDTAAERRMGTPEELGFALATVADERNGYLAGVDILCDGGSITGKKFIK